MYNIGINFFQEEKIMFSQNLKYLRKKHDMEQIDLAHKLGRKSASSVSEWEKENTLLK
ncbi:helix-turn-helix domain-containing protein [Staphylococcus aureus]